MSPPLGYTETMPSDLHEWEVIQIKFYLFRVMRYTVFLLRCSQTKSLVGIAGSVQLYSAQPEILITEVRYLLLLGVFSYLVCNESVSRIRQSILC